YLDKYPGVKKYMADTVAFAKENGYVTTIFERRRDIPELKSQKFVERSFGERVALNTPIQGSSADIIKLAMVKVFKSLKEGGYKSRLILQVHDELIVETHKDEVNEVKEILKNCMESVVELSVPIPVDVGEGESWYEAK
ncbi:MAG: DNA polymerase I, partial [Candidatus Methanomethylophilaceae archaeon]|nr:DNA polymerase I [Candidatus Methanomethylophilaceae archaeon]